MLLPPSPAHAGHYATTGPTGGVASTTPAGPPDRPYTDIQDDGYGQGGYGAVVSSGGHPSSASCSGTITTVYTWQADYSGDEPPQRVVVCETCAARCWADDYPPTGTSTRPPRPICLDGLEDPPDVTTITINDDQYPYDPVGTVVFAVSTGTRYKIVDGGPEVRVPCTPSVSISAPNGSSHASVVYSVSVSPLELMLTGGIGPNKVKRYLIGQQCTATLSSGGLTPSNYNWTASGGDPFQFWTAGQDEAELTPLSFNTFSFFNFYFKKPDEGTVTCMADLAVPPGTKPTGGFPGTVVTQRCRVEPPSASFSAYIGDVEFPNPAVTLTGLPDPGGYDQPVGITWPSFAQTPADYSLNGLGGWNYVQIDTSDERRVNSGIAQAFTLNGIPCLDNSWPYDATSYPADAGGVGAFAADGNVYTRADAPLSSVFDGLSYFNQEDGFQTWLMYCPPGSNSSYVPIRKIKWYWHASLSLISNAWSLTSSSSDCGWSFDGGLYPEFPEWHERLNNGYLEDPSAFTPPVP